MIYEARVVYAGLLPDRARERLEALGKDVVLTNSNLWEIRFEFRMAGDAGEFTGTQKYTHAPMNFTLADATSLALRAVRNVAIEFQLEGELREVSAKISRVLRVNGRDMP